MVFEQFFSKKCLSSVKNIDKISCVIFKTHVINTKLLAMY